MRPVLLTHFPLVVLIGLISSSFGGGGYLVRVGPAPIRFASAPARLDPAAVLPPLNMAEEKTNNTAAASLETTEFGPQPLPETTVVSSPNTDLIIGPDPLNPPNSNSNP